MARRRFFVPEVRRGFAELAGADAEHLVRVLRVEPGQVYELSDNRKSYLAEIETARKSSVVFRIQEELPPEPARVHIALYSALIKFDRFEWMVEKATELGVSTIVPFAAERSEHGLLQASRKRRERWQKIALEASQQARRTQMPVVDESARSLRLVQPARLTFFLDEQPGTEPVVKRLPQARKATDELAIVIGPEGGWTEAERAFATESGWFACSLGATVLRAETAAVAALAVIQAEWEAMTAA